MVTRHTLAVTIVAIGLTCGQDMLINPFGDFGVDATAPTLDSATIDGDQLTLNFSESVSAGTGWDLTDLDLDYQTSGTNVNPDSVDSGDGTSTWVLTMGTAITAGETVNLDFNGDADSVEDAAGNDLASITDGSVTNNTGGSWLISETFETNPGYDEAGWSVIQGTVDPDATTSPSPIVGSESCELVDAAADGLLEIEFSAQSEVWVYWQGVAEASGTPITHMSLRDASNNLLASVEVGADYDELYLNSGATSANTGQNDWVNHTTVHHFWVHYTAGSGSDSTCYLYASTDGTQGSAIRSITGENETADAVELRFYGGDVHQMNIDQVIVSSTNPGDNPTP